MKIRFTKDFLEHKINEVIEVTQERGNYLISVNVAVIELVKIKK